MKWVTREHVHVDRTACPWPPAIIARRIPLPASAVAAPRVPKTTVPIIMAAVISVAVVRPSVRDRGAFDPAFSEFTVVTSPAD